MTRLTAFALGFGLALSLAAPAGGQTPSASPTAVQGGTFRLDPAHSRVTWTVDHFGFSTYAGIFPRVNGVLKLDPKAVSAASLDVTVDVAGVGTLDPALDADLRSPGYLDTARFPKATFHATHVLQTGERTADITGDLTLKGVTRPVTIQATFNQAGPSPVDRRYVLGFSGAARLKRSEFGVTEFLPLVGDEVTLSIQAEFKAQPPG